MVVQVRPTGEGNGWKLKGNAVRRRTPRTPNSKTPPNHPSPVKLAHGRKTSPQLANQKLLSSFAQSKRLGAAVKGATEDHKWDDILCSRTACQLDAGICHRCKSRLNKEGRSAAEIRMRGASLHGSCFYTKPVCISSVESPPPHPRRVAPVGAKGEFGRDVEQEERQRQGGACELELQHHKQCSGA